jgi:hypothetical protein
MIFFYCTSNLSQTSLATNLVYFIASCCWLAYSWPFHKKQWSIRPLIRPLLIFLKLHPFFMIGQFFVGHCTMQIIIQMAFQKTVLLDGNKEQYQTYIFRGHRFWVGLLASVHSTVHSCWGLLVDWVPST